MKPTHQWSKPVRSCKGAGFPVLRVRECFNCRARMFQTQYGYTGMFQVWWIAPGETKAKAIRQRPPCGPLPGVVRVEPDPLLVLADDGGIACS